MNDPLEEIEVPTEEFVDEEPTYEEGDESLETEDSSDEYLEVEVSNADELWDAVDLADLISDTEDEDQETDDAEADDAAFPSEDDDDDAEEEESETPDYEVEDMDDDLEEREQELLDIDLDKPTPLSRRKAERVVKNVIEPLRDPNTPIDDVLEALAEFHPTRTQQLAEKIVAESVGAYPDAWLQSITGLDVTVDQIRQWAEQGGSSPSNTAPAYSFDATDTSIVDNLNDVYGEDWKNPAMDEYLLDEDVPLVKAIRSQASKDAAYAQLQEELARTRQELDAIKPEIESIRSAQEKEIENLFEQTYMREVEEYRNKVENRALPHLLESYGLNPKDSDTPEVKDLKEVLASRFKSVEGYGSEFDVFLEKSFSGRESMNKALQRVGSYLIEASKLQVQEQKTGDQLAGRKAKALKAQAVAEQDALTVWTRKAAAEFLSTASIKPIVRLLEQNQNLQTKVRRNSRPEIIGQTTALGANDWKDQVKEAKEQGVNPFDLDISNLLSGR